MKRKLSALLALVLAVVMVFPTAVFVSAEETNSVGKFDVTVDDKTFNKDTTYEVPVGKDIVIKVSVDTGVTVTADVSNNSAVTEKTSAGNTFTFTGKYPDESTDITLTATKTIPAAEDGQEPTTATEVKETKVVKVSCILPTAQKDKITISYTGHNEGDVNSLAPGAIVSNAILNIPLTNGDTISNVSAKVNTDDNFDDATKDYSSVKVKSGDTKLYFQYTIEKKYGNYTFEETGVYEHSIYVLGKTIDELHITGTKKNNYKAEDSVVKDEDLAVVAEYSDGTSAQLTTYNKVGLYSASSVAAAIEKAKNASSQKANNLGDYRTGEAVYIVIEHDGVYGATLVSDSSESILNYSNPVVKEVEVVSVGASSASPYVVVDGQTLGADTFDDVVIRITYQDGTEEYYMNDNGGTYEGKTVKGIRQIPGTLKFDPFDANTDGVTFTYKANNSQKKILGSLSCSGLDITVLEKQVESLDIANKTGVKVDYKAGEKLNLDGLTLKVTYNNGLTEDISYANPAITYNPKQNDALTEDITFVLFVYKYQDASGNTQEKSCKLPITVKKDTSTPTKQVTTVLLNESYNAKKDYFIGEAFQADGFSITVVYNDGSTVRKDLEDCFNFKVNNTRYYDNDDKQFTRAMVGSLEISFTLSIASNSPVFTVTISDITAKVRPVLKSITVSSSKDTYMEGDAPRVCDFKIIAKYDDDTTRVFEVDDDVTTKTSYTVTTNNVTYTVKVSPTSITADTETIRVTYSEKVSGQTAKSAYADYEIEEVTVPEAIMRYYDTTERSWLTKSYEDFYDALEDAEEIMDDYSSVYASRIPEIQLRKDVVMLSDFTTTETMEIDLNGHSITMIRGDISVSTRAATGTEVRITNSDRTDGKLIFSSDDEDTVLIAYNDIFTIDEDTVGAGKYDITITAAKNGKVTGPDEVTHGHDAQFTITPDEGYEIATIKVNNKTVAIPAAGEKLTVKDIQAKQTITVTFKEKAWDCPFTDIYKSATYYKSIQFVYENELFQGTSATKFEPDTTMTRAMFVTVLGRLAEVNVNNYTGTSFTDVKNSAATSWYVPYVEWASSIGLVEGYGNGKFGPDDPITHAQMYVLMQRYALLVEKLSTSASGTSIPANDVKDIPDWAIEAVRYAAKKDFLVLSANRLTPNANAKRSELAVLLDDFCHNVLAWDK